MIRFLQPVLSEQFASRRLLCEDVHVFHNKALKDSSRSSNDDWQVELGDTLLFDLAGLSALADAIKSYAGSANRLQFKLKLSPEALRDYYGHSISVVDGGVNLPITAQRAGAFNPMETLEVILPELSTDVAFPLALTPPDKSCIPLALLLPYSCSHDLLFANQIAVISNIASQVKRSPLSWIRAVFSRQGGTLRQRIPLHWNQIAPDARVHPTAVIEGSVIGPGCRIGAHCVVRYSVLGQQVHLHDGAKVEYSSVDDHTWLMHDLVLYRCLVESHVFLIHGPYQFSYFQHQSAAFANIMMDYRPDGRAIQINTPNGIRAYQGRFLGALLEEGAKVFGGTLTAPGITVPKEKQLCVKAEQVIKAKDLLGAASV